MFDYNNRNMAPEQAIDMVEELCSQMNLTYEQWQAFDVVIQAAYKEIRMEPEPDGSSFACPHCGRWVYGTQRRCEKCGQMLKWPQETSE